MTSNISLPKFIEQFIFKDSNKVTYRSLIIKVDYFNKNKQFFNNILQYSNTQLTNYKVLLER